MEIILYYGNECPYCHKIMPLIDDLIKEDKNIIKKEVWNNKDNDNEFASLKEIVIPACGGEFLVPCFYDKKNNEALCGALKIKEVKKWILEDKRN